MTLHSPAATDRRTFLSRSLAGGVSFAFAQDSGLSRYLNASETTVPQQRPLDTTPSTYVLFLDMQEVDSLLLCEQAVARATKHPNNPVLPAGNVDDWDSDRASNWAGSLIYDEEDGIFKAWYYGRDIKTASDPKCANPQRGIGYATSEDGVYWDKPKLGLYEFAGNKDNNISFQVPNRLTSHFAALKDPNEPNPQRRYQALTWMAFRPDGSGPMKYIPHYSPDGIHWTRSGDGVEWPAGDTGYIMIDEEDVPERRFKAYGQHNCGTGPDIEHMKMQGLPISPNEGTEHEIHFIYTIRYRDRYFPMLYDFNRYQPFYNHTGYRWHDDVNMSRQDRVRRRVALNRGKLPAEEPSDEYGIYVGDIRLAANREGLGKFQRIQPTQPVVVRGDRNEWDSGFLVLGGGSLIERDDKIYIFYSGVNEKTASAFPGLCTGPIQTGLATLRRDGFTYLRAQDVLTPGVMTTKPLDVVAPDRSQLVVNVSHTLPWRDWIEVEVLDGQTNQPIPGYARKDSVGLMRDGLRAESAWKDHQTLAGIGAGKIRLRFHFYGRARLYSFTFKTA